MLNKKVLYIIKFILDLTYENYWTLLQIVNSKSQTFNFYQGLKIILTKITSDVTGMFSTSILKMLLVTIVKCLNWNIHAFVFIT
jgi:hypothetical protein